MKRHSYTDDLIEADPETSGLHTACIVASDDLEAQLRAAMRQSVEQQDAAELAAIDDDDRIRRALDIVAANQYSRASRAALHTLHAALQNLQALSRDQRRVMDMAAPGEITPADFDLANLCQGFLAEFYRTRGYEITFPVLASERIRLTDRISCRKREVA